MLESSKKVLIVCRLLWTGGVQRVSIAETISIRNLGIACDLLFLRKDPKCDYELPSGTRVLEIERSSRPRMSKQLLRAITSIYAGHRGTDATVDLDLIVSSQRIVADYDVAVYNDQYAALWAALCRVFRAKPYVLTLHEFYPRVSKRLRDRLFFPLADLIDYLSILIAPAIITTSARNFKKIDALVPGRTVLARIGCPAPDLSLLKQNRNTRRIVANTIWDEGRHPELYVRLAKKLPEFQFVLIGRWTNETFKKEVEESARDVTNLLITGYVSEQDRLRLLDEALIYTSFGYCEAGPGMAGLDALAKGMIVITNDGIGLSELITNEVNGFVARPFSIDVVVSILKRIEFMDPRHLMGITTNAIETSERWSWESHAKGVLTACEIACRKSRKRDVAQV